jgi:hypothetical protein
MSLPLEDPLALLVPQKHVRALLDSLLNKLLITATDDQLYPPNMLDEWAYRAASCSRLVPLFGSRILRFNISALE